MKYSLYVSSSGWHRPDVVIENHEGHKLSTEWKRVYFTGLSRLVREIELQYLGAHISRKAHYFLALQSQLSIIYRNPRLGLSELLVGYVASFDSVDKIQTPLHVRSLHPSKSTWISRTAIVTGIFSTTFGPDIEWDRLRFSRNYTLFVWDLSVDSKATHVPSECLITTNIEVAISLKHQLQGNKNFLQYWRLSDVDVYNGIFSVKNAQVHLTDSSHAIENISWPTNKIYQVGDSMQIIEPFTSNPIKLGKAILLGSSSSWYHFLVEIFPRFLMLPNTDALNSTVIVRGVIPISVQEVIRHLGYLNILSVNDGEKVHVAELITVSDFRYGNPLDVESRKDDLIKVRDYFRNAPIREAPQVNIYVKRSHNLFRPLLGQKRLEKFLTQNGFEVIRPEDLNLERQLTIFANARIVVSESGAALTNMLFMSSASLIIEINPGNDPVKLWSRFASVLGLKLIIVNGQPLRFFNSLTGLGMFRINFIDFKKLIEEEI